MEDLFQFLKEIPFFRDLSDAEIQQIRQVCHPIQFDAGQIILEEGSSPNRFYIVMEGAVEVWKDHRSPDRSLLAVYGPGQFFGEIALIDDLPRSATVASREPVRLYYINQEDFKSILVANGRIALSISRAVSAMVRENTNAFLESLRRRNRELEEANRELQEAQDELLKTERLSTVGKFSSLILHDIRNPLSILHTLAEMILLDTSDRSLAERNARRIIQEVDQLDRLVGELLDYARGEIRLNMSVVDLGRFFGRLADSLQGRFQARGIAVETDLGFAGLVIWDEPRMQRVFQNLADNAWKAMPEGGRFRIRTTRGERFLVIEIIDTGIGMTPAVQKRIFEPFFSRSKEGGTGLGMTIVQNVVRAHQGTLAVDSRPNAGTTFRLTFPLFE
jgi:signal transduction histidine kinase